MIIANVMDAIANRLDTISGLRCFAYPPDDIDPPAAWPEYPDTTFDATYGRGTDEMSMTVYVALERVDDRTNRDRISAYASGSGASSVKAVLESGTYTAFDTVRVVGNEFGFMSIAGTLYFVASFELDIAGAGA